MKKLNIITFLISKYWKNLMSRVCLYLQIEIDKFKSYYYSENIFLRFCVALGAMVLS